MKHIHIAILASISFWATLIILSNSGDFYLKMVIFDKVIVDIKGTEQ